MKVQKSFDLLNSEGPLIKIEKIDELWHYNFHGSKTRHIITIKEILGAIVSGKSIIDRANGKIYFLEDYPISMKGGDPTYYEDIVEFLLNEELVKCKKDINYFKKIFLS